MKVSARTQYGLRILIQLGSETRHGRRVQGKEIAAQQGINEPYLEQIMVSLKKAGMIQTVRGRNGGYLLAEDPKNVNLLQVIEVFEGQLDLADAGEGLPNSSPESLAASASWTELTQTLRQTAGAITLQGIIEHKQDTLVYFI